MHLGVSLGILFFLHTGPVPISRSAIASSPTNFESKPCLVRRLGRQHSVLVYLRIQLIHLGHNERADAQQAQVQFHTSNVAITKVTLIF